MGNISGGSTLPLVTDAGIFGFNAAGVATNPDINDAGRVVFFATLDAGGEGIFTIGSSGGPITTVADSSGEFLYFGTPAINNDGTVAFAANLLAGGQRVVTASSAGGPATTVAETGGAFGFFGNVAINRSGMVAFAANLNTGGGGIFTGPDAINDRVIATGDPLFCSTVIGVQFSREGMNDAGQIAFYFELADGRSGFAAATRLTPADQWRRQYFGTPKNAGRGAMTADPDGDGLTNLLELAFGMDPTSGSSAAARDLPDGSIVPGLPHPDRNLNTGAIEAVFVRRKDYMALGLTYLVIFSSDLVNMTPSIHTPTVIADDGVLQVVTVPYPPSEHFFRVQVTGP